MLENIPLSRVMVLDIETVPAASSFEALPDRIKPLWKHKAEKLREYRNNEKEAAELYFERGGIYAEFGKIVCISAGVFSDTESGPEYRVKSFYDHKEDRLLKNFQEMLDAHFSISKNFLCAHNGKEFDFPYISRRCVVNNLPLPKMLDISGKKPWETGHLLDTMDMWRFGDFKNYTSLDLLAAIFGIDSPKDDIKGADVANVYWYDNDLDRIRRYCEKDIITLARVLMHFKGAGQLADEQIRYTTEEKA